MPGKSLQGKHSNEDTFVTQWLVGTSHAFASWWHMGTSHATMHVHGMETAIKNFDKIYILSFLKRHF